MKKKFFVLWIAGILGTIAVLPYAFALQQDIIAKASVPLSIIALASILQIAILLAITVFFGLKLSQSLRLPGLILFEPDTRIKSKLLRIVRFAIPAGILTAILIMAVDIFFGRYIPELAGVNARISIWKTLLASFYGGIVEEILMRLFLVSLIAWLLAKISKSIEPVKNNFIMWLAIIIAAVLFGLGHLPATSSFAAITPVVILRAIVLNGIGGLVFGWLFWKKGLESAIVAHFAADIVLLSILPLIVK